MGEDNKNYYKSTWEMGNCSDKNVIFLNMKGMADSRFSHFHITKDDVKLLIKDLEMLINNEDEHLNYTIRRL